VSQPTDVNSSTSVSQPTDVNSSASTSQPTAKKRKAPTAKSSEPTSKSARRLSDDKLYETFKNSVYTDVNTSLNITDEEEKSSTDEIFTQIKMFHEAQKGLQSKLMYYYCFIGRNMMQLKEDHKHNNKKIDEWLLKNLGQDHGLSRSNRDFFIDYYKCSLVNNKLMYVAKPYGDIKTRWGGEGGLKKHVENDKTFDWKHV